MNDVLALVQATRTSPDTSPGFASRHMLAELLALHQDMIEQLRLESLEVPKRTDFLYGMIEQHERAAHMLREKLETMQLRLPATD